MNYRNAHLKRKALLALKGRCVQEVRAEFVFVDKGEYEVSIEHIRFTDGSTLYLQGEEVKDGAIAVGVLSEGK